MTTYSAEMEETPRISPQKKKKIAHHLKKYLREYTEVTGIHGVRYVLENRTRIEKLVWGICLILCLIGCMHMIFEVLNKYKNSPVVVNFSSQDTPLYEIPFPAVTICPEIKYSKQEFDYTSIYQRVQKNEVLNEAETNVYDHLSLVCYVETGDFNGRNKIEEGENVYNTIDKLKPDADFLMPACILGATESCNHLFNPILIDEGICYSFNIYGRDEIFRDHVFHYKDYYKVPNKSQGFFDIEIGYSQTAGPNPYPRRALRSGADDAFVIFFKYDKNESDFICNPFFQGFRVLLHNAWDVPRVSQHHFHVPLDKVVVTAVDPEMIVTSPEVKRFAPDKRKCYMQDERPLEHFRFYTQSNCLLECHANYTLGKCGCVNFSMPRRNTTPICGTGSLDCMGKVDDELSEQQLEAKLSNNDLCDCKPSCTSIKYKLETSQSEFLFNEYFAAKNVNITNGDSWSVLQLYFKHEQFITMERNELYGVSDLIANLGGLLGLFTGFSLISGFEIIYFCSLRLYCNIKLYGNWSGPPA